MKDGSVQSRTIEWLRFFCAALVVLLHAFGPRAASYNNGVYDAIRILFSQGICRVAVPIFFLISGYLFFIKLERWDTRVWTNKLKKRIHTLLIPFFVWNLIAITISLFFFCKKYIFQGGDAPDLQSWFESIGGIRAFWDSVSGLYPIDGPLWFIRNLIILVILAPILYFYLKRTRIVGVLILGLLYLFRCWIRIPGFESTGFMFFSLGAFFSINQISFTTFFQKHRLLITILALPPLIGIVFTYGNNNEALLLFRDIFTLTGSASIIGIASYLIANNKIHEKAFLSNSSFFVFAAHNVFLLLYIMQHINRILPATSQIALLFKYFAAPCITILILLGCYFIMCQLTPRLLAFLTGRD